MSLFDRVNGRTRYANQHAVPLFASLLESASFSCLVICEIVVLGVSSLGFQATAASFQGCGLVVLLIVCLMLGMCCFALKATVWPRLLH